MDISIQNHQTITLQFTDVMMNKPGIYQVSFHVKSTNHIPTQYQPHDLFTFIDDSEKAVMKPWTQSVDRDEPVIFCENYIKMQLNKEFVDETKLVLMIFKIEEEDYTKALNMVAQAEIKLKPFKPIFYTNESEMNFSKEKMVHLFKSSPGSNISFHVGWMKYVYTVTEDQIDDMNEKIDINTVASEITQDIVIDDNDTMEDEGNRTVHELRLDITPSLLRKTSKKARLDNLKISQANDKNLYGKESKDVVGELSSQLFEKDMTVDEVFKRSNKTKHSTTTIIKKNVLGGKETMSVLENENNVDFDEMNDGARTIVTPSSPTPSASTPSLQSSPTVSSLGNAAISDVSNQKSLSRPKDTFDCVDKDLYLRRKTMESALGLDIDLPDINAVKLLLPKYKKLKSKASNKEQSSEETTNDHNDKSSTQDSISLDASDKLNLSKEEKDKLGSHVLAVLDYQKEEIERLCKLVQNMGDDVMCLRKEKMSLEQEVSKLSSNIHFNKNVDSEEKNDDPVVYFKQKLLAEEASKLQLQARIYNLQSELIKKNEMEERYLILQENYKTLEMEMKKVRSKNEKYKKLENTCRRQEQVICEMEQYLDEQNNDEAKAKGSRDYKSVTFGKETRRKDKKSIVRNNECLGNQDQQGGNQLNNDNETNEKLFLIQKLNEYQETITSLEQQLYENTRRWAQERSALECYEDDWYTSRFPSRRPVRMPPLIRSRSIEPGYLTNRRVFEFNRNNFPRYSYNRTHEKTKSFS